MQNEFLEKLENMKKKNRLFKEKSLSPQPQRSQSPEHET
jgi:hypothetical protein